MRRYLYSMITLTLIGLNLNAQIIQIDTVKSTYIYKKQSKNNYINQTEYMYTLGFNLLSIGQFPKILNQTNSADYIRSIPNGLMFKFNDNQISYRISGNFYKNDEFSFKNDCEECESAKGKLNDLAIKIGFEKNINYTVIQPYLGVDLGFKRNRFKGQATNAGFTDYTANYDVVAEKTSGVIAPVIGIKFNTIQHFTLALESSIDMLYSYERQEKTYHDAQHTRTFQKNNKMELLIRPVAFLSLQYNFAPED